MDFIEPMARSIRTDMGDILPTFREASFHFEDGIPDHVEDTPTVPQLVGMYGLFGATESNKPYPLAYDIPDEQAARLLADARARQQEATIETYGYSDDVYIDFPDGTKERTYYGRSRD